MKVSPPDPGNDCVLTEVLHSTVNVSVCSSVGQHRLVALAAAEPRHLQLGEAGRGRTGELRQCLVNIGIVISWKNIVQLIKIHS